MIKLLQAYKNNRSWLEQVKRRYSWQFAVKSESALIGFLVKVSSVMVGKMSRTWVLAIVSFSRFCIKTIRRSGPKGLALYLKACSILLMKYCAKQDLKDLTPLKMRVSRTKSGIPRIVVPNHRKRIRNGDTSIIRFWMTLFGLYRVLDFKGTFSIKTITNPGKVVTEDVTFLVPWFVKQFTIPRLREWRVLGLTKSGPLAQQGRSKNPHKGMVDAGKKEPKWVSRQTTMSVCAIQAYAIVHEHPYILHAMDRLQAVINPSWSNLTSEVIRSLASLGTGGLVFAKSMGKLGTKQEPGKVRVFAMVDYWTQLVLKPMHDGLFTILKSIPQDGTFDQDAAVERIRKSVGSSGFVASYDLSAATDRLPAWLQSEVINGIWPGAGEPWKELLVSRAYSIPRTYASYGRHVHYAVGQPMGAYSSWAMLALTHHYIIQLAANRVGILQWFDRYAVLGDDVVIWDNQVAKEYLRVMDLLGVEISFAKSLVSYNGTWEFAKRFVVKGVDCSPVALKEAQAACVSLDALLQLIRKCGVKVRPATVLGYMGKGYRVKGTLMKPLTQVSNVVHKVLIYMAQPGMSEVSFGRWAEWVGMEGLHRTNLERPWKDYLKVIFDQVAKFAPARISREHLKRVSKGNSLWESVLYPSFQDHTLQADRDQLELRLEVLFRPLIKEQEIKLSKALKLVPPKEAYSEATAECFDKVFSLMLTYIDQAANLETKWRSFCINSVDEGLRRSIGWWSTVFTLFRFPPPRPKYVRKPIKLDFRSSMTQGRTGKSFTKVETRSSLEMKINRGLSPDLASLVLGG